MDESPRPLVHSVDAEKSVVADQVATINMGDVRQYRIDLARRENKVYVWNVPPRAHTFTGREDELEEIGQGLEAGQGVALCQALVGGGGYGKTALAAEYAWRAFEGYASCVWLNAETDEKLNASLAELYRTVDPDGSLAKELPAQIELGRQWLAAPTRLLREGQPLLVVLDNAPSPHGALNRLALGPGIRVLATTRATSVGNVFRRVRVELLPLEAAQLLLLRRSGHVPPGGAPEDAPEAERRYARGAAETLGRLALALDQVGAQFEGRSLGEFPLWWQRKREHVLQAYGEPKDGFHESVWVTVLGAWEALRDEDLAAAQMVLACAWLDPDRIPLELFVLAAPDWPEPLAAAVADPLDAAYLADVAAARSLIEVREDPIPLRWSETNESFEALRPWRSLSLHRLTQEVLRIAIAVSDLRTNQADVVVALNASFPKQDHRLWALHERMVPCWRASLQGVNAQVKGAGRVANGMGYYLRQRGALDGAMAAFREAERIDRAAYGDDHPQVATDVNNVGAVLQARGDLDGAMAAYREAERIDRAAYGDDHPEVATDVNNVGAVLQARGALDGAMAAFREAERIFRIAYGDDHPQVAVSVNNVGTVLRARGDLDGAMAAYREAERIDRAAYGDDHPEVATDVNNVGTVLKDRGDLDGAMAAYREAERIDRAAYGNDHPQVAIRVNNVGGVLRARGDLDGAMAAYREAERIDRAAYGDDHPQVAIRVNNFGGVLQAWGDLDGAMKASSEAFLILFRAFGPQGENVGTAALNVFSVGGDPVALVRERFGEDAAREFLQALQEKLKTSRA